MIHVLDRLELEELQAAPTSHISEPTLLLGYSRTPASHPKPRRCACGDRIVVASGSDEDLLSGVGAHNATSTHAAWRSRQGIR